MDRHEAARLPPCPTESWMESVLGAHEQALLGHALRLLGDVHVARDVVQDVLLRWWQGPRLPPDHPHLAAWLHRVCHNRAIDHLRRAKRTCLLDVASAPADDGLSVEGRLVAAEGRADLLALVRRLSPRQQEVVWLRFRAGLTYREIAEVLSTSIGNVGFVLHEALRALRERLGELCPAHPGGRS